MSRSLRFRAETVCVIAASCYVVAKEAWPGVAIAGRLLLCGWMRSIEPSEELRIGGSGNTVHYFMSTNVWLAWIMRHESTPINPRSIQPLWSSEAEFSDFSPFSLCKGDDEFVSITDAHVILPYGVLVLPLIPEFRVVAAQQAAFETDCDQTGCAMINDSIAP